MVLDAVSNFVRGTADAEVGTDDTTVSVADASIFPDPETDGEFNVVIWDANNFPRPDQDADVEILRVTERDTDANELTVTRGQEMTSAATHPEGSAIHLSPTAKMFSDIESTFGDFWDAGAQELTADVNNTNTTTEALEAESGNINTIRTYRLGVLAELASSQDIADNTETKIQFESKILGNDPDIIDADKNAVIVPENVSFCKVNVSLFFDSVVDLDNFDVRKNGSVNYAGSFRMVDSNWSMRAFPPFQTTWFPVNQGDEITVQTAHNSGVMKTLSNDNRTRLGVWFI